MRAAPQFVMRSDAQRTLRTVAASRPESAADRSEGEG